MENLVKDGERVDDLQILGLKIIQHPQKYCFTSDAVYLADFTRVKSGENVCEFGTGSGVILLLLAAKCRGLKHAFGIEVQEYMSELADRNVRLNKMEDRVEIIPGRVQDAPRLLLGKRIDVVAVNPPYRKKGDGERSGSEEVALSRHEILLTLEELAEAAGKLLETGGRFYLVHRADRLGEIFREMYRNRIVPKTLRPVQSKAERAPHLVLIEGVKDGGEGLTWLPPLVTFGEDGEETEEIKRMYRREVK